MRQDVPSNFLTGIILNEKSNEEHETAVMVSLPRGIPKCHVNACDFISSLFRPTESDYFCLL